MNYEYEGIEYKIIAESKMRLGNSWVDVVIYIDAYWETGSYNSHIKVMMKDEFYRSFKKKKESV